LFFVARMLSTTRCTWALCFWCSGGQHSP
jgi:hypothetical protein